MSNSTLLQGLQENVAQCFNPAATFVISFYHLPLLIILDHLAPGSNDVKAEWLYATMPEIRKQVKAMLDVSEMYLTQRWKAHSTTLNLL